MSCRSFVVNVWLNGKNLLLEYLKDGILLSWTNRDYPTLRPKRQDESCVVQVIFHDVLGEMPSQHLLVRKNMSFQWTFLSQV